MTRVGPALAAVVSLLLQGGSSAQTPPDGAVRIRAHMEFLADDLLEGREAGTRGYDLAARYVESTLKALGVEPGADGDSFLQTVPMRKSRRTSGSIVLTPQSGTPVSLSSPREALVLPDPLRTAVDVTGPLVYAGFGVTAPELNYDDYAGLDARGRIVVVFSNAPAQFATEPRAHYSSVIEKKRNAEAHGAVGVIMTPLPSDEKLFAWDRQAAALAEPMVTWLGSDGEPADSSPPLRARVGLGPAGARRVFGLGPVPIEQVYEAAERGEPKGFEIAATAAIRTSSEHTSFSSANVIGVLKGSDPSLAATYVVLTAHLDHVGIGTAVKGDAIYNGAYDNAMGCAILIEVARRLTADAARPRRSVMFAFVTAEEKGLIGSDYFARHPPVPAGSLVANINLDMPVLQWPIADLIAFGAGNSTLEGVVEQAVARVGLKVAPDPIPQENLFVRSDQYSLVKQGVPAVFLFPAFGSKDPAKSGADIFNRFLATHYHQPSDDLHLPIDLGAVAAFTEANYLIARAIADDPIAPSWKPNNFFGERFGRR
jgi:hypothetical protein